MNRLGFRRDKRGSGSTDTKCIHSHSSLKDTLYSVPSQNPLSLCQSFTSLLVFAHMHKSCDTRILGPRCKTISTYRTVLEISPLRSAEIARCVRSQSYSWFRCQTDAGGGIWRCLAIEVKVRGMAPDLHKIHELTMPVSRWQIAGCWGHP